MSNKKLIRCMEHEHLVEQYVGEEKTRNTSQLESVGGYASVTSSISTWEALLVHLLESWEHHFDTSSISTWEASLVHLLESWEHHSDTSSISTWDMDYSLAALSPWDIVLILAA